MKLQKKFMRLAITKAKKGIKKGENPFGACIVKDNKIISCVYDKVCSSNDATAHAEMRAINQACRSLSSYNLSGCVLYSTCEPCPMCFSAIYYSNISTLVFGISVKDGRGMGYLKESIPTSKIKLVFRDKNKVKIFGNFLKDEALSLIKLWERVNLK
jgi:tRNA(Arg) A34 adenosine deaminase TadA